MNKRKMVVLAVVGLLLVGAVVVLMPNANAQGNISGNMAVYIQPYGENAERESANVDIGDPNGVEQFLMIFGGNIRTTTFTPNFTQNVGGIFKEARYEVWAVATLRLDSVNVKRVTNSLVTLDGNVWSVATGTATHYAFTGGSKVQVISAPNVLTSAWGAPQVIGFNHLATNATPSGGGTFSLKREVSALVWSDLKGADIDKFVLALNIYIEGQGPGGIVVKMDKRVTCQITVTNWAQAILQLYITGFSMSSNVLSIAPPMEMIAQPRFEAS
jgi:hypothetical protein